jgi:hypothetical protein
METESELLFDVDLVIHSVLNNKIPNWKVIEELCKRTRGLILAEPVLINITSERPVIITGIVIPQENTDVQDAFMVT